jgi:Protein of unknown function (DUF3105)
MASRKEEKERLRAERLAAEASQTSSERRRLMIGYVVAGVLAAAVLAGLVVVIASSGGGGAEGVDACGEAHVQAASGTTHGLDFDCRSGTEPAAIKTGDLAAAAKLAGCELKTNLPDEGNTHVPDSTAVKYKTNPPTSGNHNQTPIADGAYSTPLNDDTGTSPNVRNFVHSMEHGRIEIHYSPDLPEEQQLELKGVFDQDPDGMLLFPDPNMPDAVAATAWTQLLSCPKYDPAVLDAVRDFRDTYRANGPETQVPISL